SPSRLQIRMRIFGRSPSAIRKRFAGRFDSARRGDPFRSPEYEQGSSIVSSIDPFVSDTRRSGACFAASDASLNTSAIQPVSVGSAWTAYFSSSGENTCGGGGASADAVGGATDADGGTATTAEALARVWRAGRSGQAVKNALASETPNCSFS